MNQGGPNGLFQDPTQVNDYYLPGSSGTAYFRIMAWTGLYNTYQDAYNASKAGRGSMSPIRASLRVWACARRIGSDSRYRHVYAVHDSESGAGSRALHTVVGGHRAGRLAGLRLAKTTQVKLTPIALWEGLGSQRPCARCRMANGGCDNTSRRHSLFRHVKCDDKKRNLAEGTRNEVHIGNCNRRANRCYDGWRRQRRSETRDRLSWLVARTKRTLMPPRTGHCGSIQAPDRIFLLIT